jgi:hypothetical protein
MGNIVSNLLSFIENKSTRLAIASVIISTVLIACVLAIVSLGYNNGGWYFAVPDEFKFAFVIAYLVLFVADWFILYLLNSKDATDVYSEVREHLVGQWIATYDANQGPESRQIVVPTRAVGCFITVNPEQKLEMAFRIRDNPIFKDDDRQTIKDVAIRYNDTGGYTMFYYYTGHRGIQPQIAMHILPEEGRNRADEVEVEIFGHVTFDKPLRGHVVDQMNGTWFDLNGNVSRLFAFLDQKTVSKIRNENFSPLRLSQVPIHQKNFDADMGTIKFNRMTGS